MMNTPSILLLQCYTVHDLMLQLVVYFVELYTGKLSSGGRPMWIVFRRTNFLYMSTSSHLINLVEQGKLPNQLYQ